MLRKYLKDNCVRQQRAFSTFSNDNEYTKVLRANAISNNVKDCQYAVRGAIPMMGEKIKKRIANGDLSYPFTKITPLNIGNPQAVGQGFIQYNRDILAAVLNPRLLESEYLNQDAKDRVTMMNSLFSSPIGAYTSNSKGHAQVRQAIANFIDQRDGGDVHSDWNKIYTTNGASEGVRMIFQMLIRDKQDGVLIPIP
jgi:alanine transaminase